MARIRSPLTVVHRCPTLDCQKQLRTENNLYPAFRLMGCRPLECDSVSAREKGFLKMYQSQQNELMNDATALTAGATTINLRLRYNRKQAALLLGLSLRTVDRRTAEKELIAVRDGRRVLYTGEILERYARRSHQCGGTR